jgi:hypothetical protein
VPRDMVRPEGLRKWKSHRESNQWSSGFQRCASNSYATAYPSNANRVKTMPSELSDKD